MSTGVVLILLIVLKLALLGLIQVWPHKPFMVADHSDMAQHWSRPDSVYLCCSALNGQNLIDQRKAGLTQHGA